ncbi:MAG: hypothetical protein U5L45_00970 [Saprospiraceae bacterium]|nr:hypothetical protein [Saprospiraceae bacterium]
MWLSATITILLCSNYKKDLRMLFSDRPCHIANAKDIDYTELMKDYLGLGRGFYLGRF